MDFQRYLRAIRKSWWIIGLLVMLGGVGSYAYSKGETPIYASRLTFYVGSPAISDSSANSTNQFATDRATSYAKLLSSQTLARLVQGSPGVSETAGRIAGKISGTAQLNTVLIDVVVRDASPQQAQAIARAVGRQFPEMVNGLDNSAASGTATVKLSVVSGPTASNVPISPRTRLNVLIGAVLGLLLGLVVAATRELLDVSISTADALAEVTGTAVLGSIVFDKGVKRHPLIIDETAYSLRAEALRQIRTNLQFMDSADGLRVIVVTSSVEGEGKSLTSVNLALSLAETGRQVLLVEADLRRPRLSDLLDVERSVGLTNVLAEQVHIDEVLQKWGSEGLTVLPSGTIPPNPVELLGSTRMADLVTDLRSRFDTVIIDSPPLLPVTDAAVLAAHADGTIVVFRHGKTRRTQIRASIESLNAVHAKVLGCVINMKPVSRRDSHRYETYYTSIEKSSDADVSTRWDRSKGRLRQLARQT